MKYPKEYNPFGDRNWISDLQIREMSLLERYPSCQITGSQKCVKTICERRKVEPNEKDIIPITSQCPLTPREGQLRLSDNSMDNKKFSQSFEVVQPQNTPNECVGSSYVSRQLGQSLSTRSSTRKEFGRQNRVLYSASLEKRTMYSEDSKFSAAESSESIRMSSRNVDLEKEGINDITPSRNKDVFALNTGLSKYSTSRITGSAEYRNGKANRTNDQALVPWRMQKPSTEGDHFNGSRQKLASNDNDHKMNQTFAKVLNDENGSILMKNISNEFYNSREIISKDVMSQKETFSDRKDRFLSSKIPKNTLLTHEYKHRKDSDNNYEQPKGNKETILPQDDELSRNTNVEKRDKKSLQEENTVVTKKNRKLVASRRIKAKKKPQGKASKKPNQKQMLSREKVETRAIVKEMIESNAVYKKSRKRILTWMSRNYGRIIDIFKRFDVDGSGSLSMAEFCQGMKSLGAPGTDEELQMMAQVLDFDDDNSIDFEEFRKLKRYSRIKSSTRFSRTQDRDNKYMRCQAGCETQDNTCGRAGCEMQDYTCSRAGCETHDKDKLPKLKPCGKCFLGITEPVVQYKYDRHISIQMSSISKLSHKKSPIGQFILDASPEMTVYGIQRLTKAELGGSATNVRIFRKRDKKRIEMLEQHKHLGDYGYKGNMNSDKPETVSLFYDYTYPKLDCPLVRASLSH